jgi:lysophospholipase L1-like esterase
MILKHEIIECPHCFPVGDSLTAGLGLPEEKAHPAVLARKLKAAGYAYRVVNAGVSGETSSGTRSHIERVVSGLAPGIVMLETGANDFGVISRRRHWPGQNHRKLRAVGR